MPVSSRNTRICGRIPKFDSSIFSVYGEGSLDGSQKKVLRELQSNDQSIDYNRATAIHVAMLDPSASGIIKHCLDRLFADNYGLFTRVELEDERYLTLTLLWKPTGGEPLIIKKQEIFNGVVLDDGKSHPTIPIMSDATLLPKLRNPVIPGGSSRTIRVERTGPYANVVFRFVVSPDIPVPDIQIPPVPEKVKWTKVFPSTSVETGLPLQQEWTASTWVNNNGLTQNGDDGHRHKHWLMTHNISEVTKDPTAVFTYVRCEKYGSPMDYMGLDGANPPFAVVAVGQGANTRDATCTGWWEESGRSMKMFVTWQRTDYSQEKLKWTPWKDRMPEASAASR